MAEENKKEALDINENVGKWSNKKITDDKEFKQEQEVVAKVEALPEDQKVKINFEKFEKNTPKKRKGLKNMNIKLDLVLENKKKLALVWCAEIFVFLLVIAIGIVMNIFKAKAEAENKPVFNLSPYTWHTAGSKAATVMAWISYFLPVPALVLLLSCLIVGVNGVHRSRLFHLFFAGSIIISFALAICVLGIDAGIIDINNSFWYKPPAE